MRAPVHQQLHEQLSAKIELQNRPCSEHQIAPTGLTIYNLLAPKRKFRSQNRAHLPGMGAPLHQLRPCHPPPSPPYCCLILPTFSPRRAVPLEGWAEQRRWMRQGVAEPATPSGPPTEASSSCPWRPARMQAVYSVSQGNDGPAPKQHSMPRPLSAGKIWCTGGTIEPPESLHSPPPSPPSRGTGAQCEVCCKDPFSLQRR